MPTLLSPGVYVQEIDSGSRPIEGVGTAVAAFVGMAAQGPLNSPTLVANWNQFETIFGGYGVDSYLPDAVYAYFLNGGGNCYVVRLGTQAALTQAQAELVVATEDKGPTAKYQVVALAEGGVGNALSVEVTDDPESASPEAFRVLVKKDGAVAETFPGLTVRGKQNAVTVVNATSQLVRLVEVPNAPTARPANAQVELRGGDVAEMNRLEPADYVGDSAARTGFGGLEAIDEVTMVCAPDVMTAFQRSWIDLEGLKAIQGAMIAHCELMGDRVAILDTPPDLGPQAVADWKTRVANFDSKYATAYWPWIKCYNPVAKGNVFVPPSGHMAGVWGRNDDTRGVHKAPAGDAIIRGAVDLASSLTSKEQELLNPIGVNCLRAFPGRGIRVWGARTLSSDPAWRYLNVRRLFNYLEKSILNGTQWVVFEPNDDALWAKIRRTVGAFLFNEWRNGALFGVSPDEAFYVKCDRETNPPEGIDAGEVVCEIGVAPVKPAEFVVFRLSQFSSGASVTY